MFGGSLQISRACFSHNSYGKDRFPGIIFLDQDSNLIQSENNYEINNTIREKDDQSECKGIFEQVSGTCGQSASQCNGSCGILMQLHVREHQSLIFHLKPHLHKFFQQ